MAVKLRSMLTALAGAVMLAACSDGDAAADIDRLARDYVRLGLAYGSVEPDALDFYFGPEDLLPGQAGADSDLEAIRAGLKKLGADLAVLPQTERRDRLARKVANLLAIMDASAGAGEMSFAEQAQQLYGITLGEPDDAALQVARDQLEALLPGQGSLARRTDAFLGSFIIPEDRREGVFLRALDECKARSGAHWALPESETLEVEWTDKVPAAWHKYHGGGQSARCRLSRGLSGPSCAIRDRGC